MKKSASKSKTRFLIPEKWHLILLVAILGFAFFTRIFRLHVPERYIFDEVYHTVTAKLIAQDDPRAFEWWNPPPEENTAVDWLHPPIAKYTQAFFISALGDSSFSWRLSSVLFGVGVIFLVYKIGTDVFDNPEVGLLAAFIASLDGLLLTQSRITMNDIHVTFFILLTLWLYWKHRQHGLTLDWTKKTWQRLLLIGISAGFALASKWSGLFVIAIIGIFEASDLLKYFFAKQQRKKPILQVFKKVASIKTVLFLSLIIVPIIVYIGSYTPMFAQGKTLLCFEQKAIQGQCYFERIKIGETVAWEGYLSHFAMLHRQIWWYQTHLDAEHTYQSRPWQWFLNLRPVWFHVAYGDNPDQIANIYAFGNPAVFWLGAIAVIFTVITLLLQNTDLARKLLPKLNSQLGFKLTFILVSYAMVWLPWVASPRIMFFYHYAPAVPLLSILLGFWLYQMLISKKQLTQNLSKAAVLMMIVCFGVWYPHWTALPVSKEFANTIYFFFKTWK